MSMTLAVVMVLLGAQDLDSPDPAVARPAIEAAIRKGDEKALEAASKTSRGARLALAEVRAHKRFGDAYPMPPTISLQVKSEPARRVVDQILSQIALKVRIEGGPESLDGVDVTLDLKDANALEALDRLSAALNRRYSIEHGRIHLDSAAPGPRSPDSIWRHVRMDLSSFHEYRDLYGAEGNAGTCMFSGGGSTDGLCRIVGRRGFRVDEVVEDTGKHVEPDPLDEPSYFDFSRYSGHGFNIEFKSIPSPAARRLSLRGAWVLMLPEGPTDKDLPLDDFTNIVESNNLTLRIESCDPVAGTATVSGRIADLKKAHVPPGPEDFKLTNRKGALIPATGSVAGPAEKPVLQLEFEVPKDFEPTALRVRVFRGVGELDVPFEWKDVPIR